MEHDRLDLRRFELSSYPLIESCALLAGFGDTLIADKPIIIVSAGHSDYQAMKPYIAIVEKTKADAMKLFDEELKK